MSINLQKGQKIDLSKGNAGFQRIMVGLGWDEATNQIQPIDCDASVILCNAKGKIIDKDIDKCCVYFGNLLDDSGSIMHQGDNLTGAGDGDDEQIRVDISNVPANIERMVFVVNIYDAFNRRQHFGMIRNAFIRLVNMDNQAEICKFNLSDNYSGMTGLVVGEIYKKNNAWRFNAIGQPVRDASFLGSLVELYA